MPFTLTGEVKLRDDSVPGCIAKSEKQFGDILRLESARQFVVNYPIPPAHHLTAGATTTYEQFARMDAFSQTLEKLNKSNGV